MSEFSLQENQLLETLLPEHQYDVFDLSLASRLSLSLTRELAEGLTAKNVLVREGEAATFKLAPSFVEQLKVELREFQGIV